MKFIFLIQFLAISGLLLSQEYDSVQIKTTAISESIHVLSKSGGGNIGVLEGEDGILIIDTHLKQFTEKIQHALSEIAQLPVKFVINTHWHYDHVGGNEAFGKQGSLIIAHVNCRDRLAENQVVTIFKPLQEATPIDGLPKITFSDSMTLYLNDEIIHIFHIENVHSNSDVIIHFKKADVFHMGDIFVRYGLPFIDVPNGGDIDGMISTCEQIISSANENSIIIPGHGRISNKHDLINYTDMMKTIRNRISKGIDKGNTLEQIIESDPAKEYNSILEKAEFIKLYYDSLLHDK